MSILDDILPHNNNFPRINIVDKLEEYKGSNILDYIQYERARILNCVESPLQAYARFLSRVEKISPQDADILRMNYPVTPLFKAEIQYRKRTWKQFLVMINGPTGTGKSLSGITICRWIYPDFDVDEHIFWSVDDMVNYVRKYAEKGCCLMLDEEISRLGTGTRGLQYALQNLECTLRYAEINFVFVYVMERPHKIHSLLYTRGEHYYRVPPGHPLREKGKDLGADYFVLGVLQPFFWKDAGYQLLGLMSVDVPPQKIISRYERHKAEFVEQMRESGGLGEIRDILTAYGYVFENLKTDETYMRLEKKSSKADYISHAYGIPRNIAVILVELFESIEIEDFELMEEI